MLSQIKINLPLMVIGGLFIGVTMFDYGGVASASWRYYACRFISKNSVSL